MTPTEVLSEVLAFVEERGWTQHVRQDETGAVCVGEAFDRVCGLNYKLRNDAMRLLAAVANFEWCDDSACPCAVFAWNDQAGRTSGEVMAALRGVA